MLSLAMESRAAVDAMNEAAAANGGKTDANPAEDYGFMYSRDLADLDGHLWGGLDGCGGGGNYQIALGATAIDSMKSPKAQIG
jgi:hypothetical protein